MHIHFRTVVYVATTAAILFTGVSAQDSASDVNQALNRANTLHDLKHFQISWIFHLISIAINQRISSARLLLTFMIVFHTKYTGP